MKDLYITAAVRCAPPDNKPLPQELANCAPYLERELDGLQKLKVVVALGKIAFDAYLNFLKRRGLLKTRKEYVFQHAAKYKMPDGRMPARLLPPIQPEHPNRETDPPHVCPHL